MKSFESLNELSNRILKREVVFFIGSGFSVDSEGNTAFRLMLRLAVRFYAMATVMNRQQDLEQWIELFSLKDANWQPIDLSTHSPEAWEAVVRKLAWDYYAANDWFCGTYDRLLVKLGQQDDSNDVISEIQSTECEILKSFIGSKIEDTVPLEGIHELLLHWARNFMGRRINVAGKALFLDTLGFTENGTMAGASYCNRQRYEANKGPELFARHEVLARLAREGLCPNIITTNYDLLLESAWQSVGFDYDDFGHEESDFRCSANTLMGLPTMMRIAGPYDFQTYGKGVETSLILKVHGCVDQYRKCRAEAVLEFNSDTNEETKITSWQRYMKSIVFTYREIQNWRSDSWSRDYLANLQRTRVVAFAGYSLQDPVIHDSLRSVYEELADYNFDVNGAGHTTEAKDAPAYFFGSGESFHANEMLTAATYAARAIPEQDSTHENFIQFKFLDKVKRNANFPNLDDLFLWNYHLTMRKFQRACLEKHLATILPSLIDRPAFPTELEKLRDNFEQLFLTEQQAIDQNFDRIALKRIVGWTFWFQSRLLRELVWGEALNRDNGPRTNLTKLRKTNWYMPFGHRPSWCAWSLVMEIAIRRVLPSQDCYPVEGQVPTIYFKRRNHWETLRLEMGNYQGLGFFDRHSYTSGLETTWVLSSLGAKTKRHDKVETLVDRGRPFGRISCPCPEPLDLWKTAASDDQDLLERMKAKLPSCDLGVTHD